MGAALDEADNIEERVWHGSNVVDLYVMDSVGWSGREEQNNGVCCLLDDEGRSRAAIGKEDNAFVSRSNNIGVPVVIEVDGGDAPTVTSR